MNSSSVVQEIIYNTIKVESETLGALLDVDFSTLEKVVHLIFEAQGRTILTGIGKSALAAQKICATLNSTGSPAIYMHAGDAMHGDLGIIQQGDVVIIISKSGNSEEIKRILPHMKSKGVPLVAFVSQDKSYLSQYADHKVFIPVTEEADPNGLAPTSSIIAHIAVGDAMALALQKLNGWSKDAFAEVHPAGALGKRLSLQVGDLYPQMKIPKVSLHTPLRQTIVQMSSQRMGAVGVCEGETLVGIITDGDLRRMLESHDDISQLNAVDIMTAKPKTITSDVLAYDALRILEHHNINQLLIVDDGRYLGMVHLHDLLAEGF